MTFPEGIMWQADGPFDTDRAAAVREALTGPMFASFTPEQRAEAMQAAISLDIHCKVETVITPVVAMNGMGLEFRTGTHLTLLAVGKGGGT